MEEYLIVDGYNIIFAWPQFEDIKEFSMEHARARLIDIMVNYAALTGVKIIVVFDAHKVKDVTRHKEDFHKVQIIYTEEGETADTLIEKLVGDLSRDNVVYVATSDWAEQRTILGRGAYRLTPKELLKKIKELKKETESFYVTDLPVNSYLENRLKENTRLILEKWRRKKN